MAREKSTRLVAWGVFWGLFMFFVVLPLATCAACTTCAGGVALTSILGRDDDPATPALAVVADRPAVVATPESDSDRTSTGSERTPVLKVVLDSNVYDELEKDPAACAALREKCAAGEVEVLVTPQTVRELSASRFAGVPDWFKSTLVADTVTIADHSFLDMSFLGEGKVYRSHRGESNKIPDAMIADAAISLGAALVSEDKRCRSRFATLGGGQQAWTFAEFRRKVLGL